MALTIVNTLLVIDAIIMIVLVVLQSGKSEGLSGAISGGAEQLFGKQKARGIDLVLHRGTVITGTLLFVLAFLSAYAFSELNWGNFREGTVLGLPIDVMWVVGRMCISLYAVSRGALSQKDFLLSKRKKTRKNKSSFH